MGKFVLVACLIGFVVLVIFGLGYAAGASA